MYSFPPIAAAISVLYTVVTYLATLLVPIFGGSSTAAAIIVMTIAIRLILTPLGWAQARAEHRRLRLAPRVREIQRRYQHKPARLRQELAALYAREGTSPLAGVLPALTQLPVFTVLYGLFLTTKVDGAANALLADSLAGVPLGDRLMDAMGSADLLVFAVLFVLLAAAAWGSVRLAAAAQTASGAPTTGAAVRLVRLLPFGTLVVAGLVPLAAGLYLLTTTAWTLAERRTFRRLIAARAEGAAGESGRSPRGRR